MTLLEVAIVIEARYGIEGGRHLDQLFVGDDLAQTDVVPAIPGAR